jgi:glyoxylase-like metal-dependent hydrolase (beta-lactamase superfamily II)/8-oxo-dGTP pyrophosphatase MutT (NUDIX family)
MAENRRPPRAAATLVILRDGPPGLEVLLTVRPQGMRFMGGAAVFPGGALDPSDLDNRWEAAANLSRSEAARALNEDDSVAALGAFVCALREAFEEVGFLFGSGPLDRVDRASVANGTEWLEHLLSLGIVLDAAALVPAGRWVTPIPSPVRFDARFFVTGAPSGWTAIPDPSEVEEARWLTPVGALEELAAGRLIMAPPTIQLLQRIEPCDDVVTALDNLATDGGEFGARPPSVRVHPMVRLFLAPNPGTMTGPGTNTYVVDTDNACVIDPAVDDPDFLDGIVGAAASIATIVVTHRHPDHIGGVRRLVDRTDAVVRAAGGGDAGGVPVVPLADEEVIATARARLECILSPGHASDHICLRLDDSLFSGDTVLGEGTAVIAPPDGNLADYLASLRRLRELDIARIFPGHFRPLARPREVIDGYLRHRAARHRAILESLADADASVDEIVSRVYTDTPSDLHPVAKWSVLAHLEMAAEEGEAARAGQKWHRMDKGQD